MLAPYRPQFVEKILTDGAGRRFRVVFAVSFVNGEARGRIVSAQEIQTIKGQAAETLCLPGISAQKHSEGISSDFAPIASPYFSLDFLINSQPTRAPSRI